MNNLEVLRKEVADEKEILLKLAKKLADKKLHEQHQSLLSYIDEYTVIEKKAKAIEDAHNYLVTNKIHDDWEYDNIEMELDKLMDDCATLSDKAIIAEKSFEDTLTVMEKLEKLESVATTEKAHLEKLFAENPTQKLEYLIQDYQIGLVNEVKFVMGIAPSSNSSEVTAYIDDVLLPKHTELHKGYQSALVEKNTNDLIISLKPEVKKENKVELVAAAKDLNKDMRGVSEVLNAQKRLQKIQDAKHTQAYIDKKVQKVFTGDSNLNAVVAVGCMEKLNDLIATDKKTAKSQDADYQLGRSAKTTIYSEGKWESELSGDAKDVVIVYQNGQEIFRVMPETNKIQFSIPEPTPYQRVCAWDMFQEMNAIKGNSLDKVVIQGNDKMKELLAKDAGVAGIKVTEEPKKKPTTDKPVKPEKPKL